MDTLELAAGGGHGTIGSISGFRRVAIDSGAYWLWSGSNTIGSGGSLAVGSGGVLALGLGGSLSLAGNLTAGSGGLRGDDSTVTTSGALSAAGYGISLRDNAAVSNTGSIVAAAGYGVQSYGNSGASTTGVIVNAAGALISGTIGVRGQYGATTVDNAGTIVGTGGTAVWLNEFQNNRVIDRPGAVFNGAVNGGNSGAYLYKSTLELASGASAGTLSGLGTRFVNFGHLNVDANAAWTLTGSNTIVAGAVMSLGAGASVALGSGGSLAVAGALSGGALGVSGSDVTVGNSGQVSGSSTGIELRNNGSVGNSGTIQGAAQFGVEFYGATGIAAVGGITNAAGGLITGAIGVRGQYASTTVDNAGTITGTGGTAIQLNIFQTNRVVDRPGAVFNGVVNLGNTGNYLHQSTLELATGSGAGTIAGVGSSFTNFGNLVVDAGASWTLSGSNALTSVSVSNAGTLAGTGGVLVLTGGAVSNAGSIVGATFGIQLRNSGSLGNSGQLQGASGYGVDAYGNGSTGGTAVIGNESGGVIVGTVGVRGRYAGTTVTNAGTIIGTGGTAVRLNGFQHNHVIVDPGAVFGGVVNLGNTGVYASYSTLELAAGASGGALSGLGSAFTNFGRMAIDSGATWTLSATNTLGAGSVLTNSGTLLLSGGVLNDGGGVVNNGQIVIDPSTMTLASLSGAGTVTIGNLSTLDVLGSISAGQTIVFADNTGVLMLGNPAGDAGTIAGFAAGDTIFVTTAGVATFSQNGSAVDVMSGATTLAALDFASSAQANAAISTSGALVDIPCFAAGTRIRTTRGEVRVEELREGDVVVTAIDGSEARVVWIGHRSVDCKRHPDPRSVWPVRISAGAFGKRMPVRALTLSPDHAVYVDDVLVPVKHLVNGTTIRQVRADRMMYFHVELDRHDVVYADGMPAESYLEVGDRANFANGGEVVRLHIDLAHHWEAGGCAPLVICGSELEAVKRRVAEHAGPATQRGDAVMPTQVGIHEFCCNTR